MDFYERSKLYAKGKMSLLQKTRYESQNIKPKHLSIYRDWEEIKKVKYLYRGGTDLKYIKKRYPNYEGFIEYEDEVLRERGGCDTAS